MERNHRNISNRNRCKIYKKKNYKTQQNKNIIEQKKIFWLKVNKTNKKQKMKIHTE